jgi:hypothetical protein
LKQITVDTFKLTKTPGIIIDNDATGAFDRVICGLALLALRSIGFALSVTKMLGTAWNKRKCFIKTGSGMSERSYQSSEQKKTFGHGQGSTAASDIWCIIHGILMHTVATYFVGIIFVSVSGSIQQKRVDEGLIDDTSLTYSAQSSTEISSTTLKDFSPNESMLFDKCRERYTFSLSYSKSQEVT